MQGIHSHSHSLARVSNTESPLAYVRPSEILHRTKFSFCFVGMHEPFLPPHFGPCCNTHHCQTSTFVSFLAFLKCYLVYENSSRYVLIKLTWSLQLARLYLIQSPYRISSTTTNKDSQGAQVFTSVPLISP